MLPDSFSSSPSFMARKTDRLSFPPSALPAFIHETALRSVRSGADPQIGMTAVAEWVEHGVLDSPAYRRVAGTIAKSKSILETLPEKIRQGPGFDSSSHSSDKLLGLMLNLAMLAAILAGGGLFLYEKFGALSSRPWAVSLGGVGSIFLFSYHAAVVSRDRVDHFLGRWGLPLSAVLFTGALLLYFGISVGLALVLAMVTGMLVKFTGHTLLQVTRELPVALKDMLQRFRAHRIEKIRRVHTCRLREAEAELQDIEQFKNQLVKAATATFLAEYHYIRQTENI